MLEAQTPPLAGPIHIHDLDRYPETIEPMEKLDHVTLDLIEVGEEVTGSYRADHEVEIDSDGVQFFRDPTAEVPIRGTEASIWVTNYVQNVDPTSLRIDTTGVENVNYLNVFGRISFVVEEALQDMEDPTILDGYAVVSVLNDGRIVGEKKGHRDENGDYVSGEVNILDPVKDEPLITFLHDVTQKHINVQKGLE